ncbi:MAG: 50S ribosomal protein L19 [Brevinematales bacterium]|nr:50S ribosomal protein L19 [Brevinematales bacterium]
MSKLIEYVNNKFLSKKEYDEFRVGDQVRVHQIIKEADGKDRIQIFEGLVIAIKGSGLSKTFTVRKISYGVGVEKIFPYYSPLIAKVEVVRRFKVRRAKLYYLRDKIGKEAKLKEIK